MKNIKIKYLLNNNVKYKIVNLDSVTAFFKIQLGKENEQQDFSSHISASSERNKFKLKVKTLLLNNKLI